MRPTLLLQDTLERSGPKLATAPIKNLHERAKETVRRGGELRNGTSNGTHLKNKLAQSQKLRLGLQLQIGTAGFEPATP